MQASGWVAIGVVALTGLVVLLTALALLAFQKGPGRAALVGGLLPAALVPAVVAVGLAALQFSHLFGGLAQAGSGSAAVVQAGAREIWWTARAGFGLTALVALGGLVGGLLRFGTAPSATVCSVRRATVLVLLPLLALLVAAFQARELRLGVGIAQAVMADVGSDATRKAAVQSYLEAHDLPTGASGGVAEISMRIARAILISGLGGTLAGVILLGLSLTGTVLAWRVRVGPAFVVASSTLCAALALAATALSLGFGAPPAF